MFFALLSPRSLHSRPSLLLMLRFCPQECVRTEADVAATRLSSVVMMMCPSLQTVFWRTRRSGRDRCLSLASNPKRCHTRDEKSGGVSQRSIKCQPVGACIMSRARDKRKEERGSRLSGACVTHSSRPESLVLQKTQAGITRGSLSFIWC